MTPRSNLDGRRSTLVVPQVPSTRRSTLRKKRSQARLLVHEYKAGRCRSPPRVVLACTTLEIITSSCGTCLYVKYLLCATYPAAKLSGQALCIDFVRRIFQRNLLARHSSIDFVREILQRSFLVRHSSIDFVRRILQRSFLVRHSASTLCDGSFSEAFWPGTLVSTLCDGSCSETL